MSVDAAGDINGDTVPDMIVGAPHDADGGPERGAAYLITLQPNGQVLGNSKISQLTSRVPLPSMSPMPATS